MISYTPGLLLIREGTFPRQRTKEGLFSPNNGSLSPRSGAAVRGATPYPRSGAAAERSYPTFKVRRGSHEDILHVQGKRNPSKTVGVVRGIRGETHKP